MRFLLVLVAVFVMTHLLAQPARDTTRSSAELLKEKFEKARQAMDEEKDLNPDSTMSHLRQLSNAQFSTSLMIEEQKQKAVAYDRFLLAHAERSFQFQYFSSIIIFIVVIVIVLLGLLFSGYQFRLTMKQLEVKEKLLNAHMRKSLKTQEASPAPAVEKTSGDSKYNELLSSLKNELEVSTTGIKVNSSVLGVIILALSIAFFYLYLTIVYPIRYVGPEAPGIEKTGKK